VAGCGVRHRPSSGSTFNALLGVCAEYGDHPAALDTLDMMTYHRYGASAAPPATLVVFDWDLPMWRLFLSRNIEGAADAASTPTTPASCTCCAPAGRRGHWLAVPAQLRAQPVNTHPPHSAVSARAAGWHTQHSLPPVRSALQLRPPPRPPPPDRYATGPTSRPRSRSTPVGVPRRRRRRLLRHCAVHPPANVGGAWHPPRPNETLRPTGGGACARTEYFPRSGLRPTVEIFEALLQVGIG
jgi:hypothetical protein